MIHSVMWNVPHLFASCRYLIKGNSLCTTIRYDVLHEAAIVLSELVVT